MSYDYDLVWRYELSVLDFFFSFGDGELEGSRWLSVERDVLMMFREVLRAGGMIGWL